MIRRSGWLAFFALTTLASAVQGQPLPSSSASAPPTPVVPAATASPPPVTPPAPLTPPATTAPFPLNAWLARYQQARQLFFEGKFDLASRELLALAAVAPDATSAFAARELGVMAAEWHRRGQTIGPIGGQPGKPVTNRSRRTNDEIASLYGYSVFYGLGTGLWLATYTRPKSGAEGILPALAFAGGSAGLVAILDRGPGMSYGVPQSIQAGLTLGLLEGIFWTTWNQARVRFDEEWDEKTVASLIWGASTAGAITGGVLGARFGTTPGRASFVSSAGLWTGTIGGMLASALTPNDKASSRDDNGLLVAALGLNVGAGLGVWKSKDVSPTIARVRFIDLGGLAGGLLAGGLFLAADDRNTSERGLLAVTSLGMAGGLGLAFHLTREMEEDRPEADEAPPAFNARASLAPVRGGMTLGLNGSW